MDSLFTEDRNNLVYRSVESFPALTPIYSFVIHLQL